MDGTCQPFSCQLFNVPAPVAGPTSSPGTSPCAFPKSNFDKVDQIHLIFQGMRRGTLILTLGAAALTIVYLWKKKAEKKKDALGAIHPQAQLPLNLSGWAVISSRPGHPDFRLDYSVANLGLRISNAPARLIHMNGVFTRNDAASVHPERGENLGWPSRIRISGVFTRRNTEFTARIKNADTNAELGNFRVRVEWEDRGHGILHSVTSAPQVQNVSVQAEILFGGNQ